MGIKRSTDTTKQGRLMLARKIGEPIYILTPDGHKITLEVTEIRGPQVRLGFVAPREYTILRHDARRPETVVSKEGKSA